MKDTRAHQDGRPRTFAEPQAPHHMAGGPPTDPSAQHAALAQHTREQFEAASAERGQLSQNVVELTGQIEAVRSDVAQQERSQTERFEALRSDSEGRFAEVGDKLNRLDARGERLEALIGQGASPSAQRMRGLTSWGHELASGGHLEKYRELSDHKQPDWKRAAVRFELKDKMLEFRRPLAPGGAFAGETTVIVDSDLVGDASDPVVRAGLTELIRDPVGLVDIVNYPPPVDADTHKEMLEDPESSAGHVVAAANGTQDGATTPQAYVTVHNTEGFFVGQSIYVWATTTGKEGPFTISAITAGTTLTFATAVIDFVVTDGDYVTGEEFAATAESGVKPAGLIKASMKSVDMQTLATYVITTRQRLRRTNLFDLAAWAQSRLPIRLREALEWHLLWGSGTAPQLYGFLNSSTLTTWSVSTDTWSTDMETGDNRADLILWAAANTPGNRQLYAVMHKLDWFRLTGAKDGNGNYVHGEGEGPRIIDTPTLKAIGGVRVVLSSKMAQTYALVIDPMGASSCGRMDDAEMLVGYVNDQLIQNQHTMLYEQSFGHLLLDGRAWRRVYLDAPPT